MKETGTTQSSLANKIGVKQQTVQSICSGKIKRSKYIPEIASYLGVNHNWLINGKGDKSIASKPEERLSYKIQYVPVLKWDEAHKFKELQADSNLLKDNHFLPVIGKIHVNSFALQVKGDSMLAEDNFSIPDGTIIIVDPQLEPKHNSVIVVFNPDNQSLVVRKLSIEGNQKYLKTLNKSYPNPVTELLDNSKILGVVCMTFKSFVDFF